MPLCRWCEARPVKHANETYAKAGFCDECGELYDNYYPAGLSGLNIEAQRMGVLCHIHDANCTGEPKGSGGGTCKRSGYRGLRISLGCGRHTMDGWFCIDAVQDSRASRQLDMVSDVKKINLPDGCAQEILAVHLWEHLYRWECDDTIEEWKRLLRPKGKLALEMPDLMKFCRNILDGVKGRKHEDQFGLWGAYGDPFTKDPLMCHHWGWTYKSIKPFLEEHGFVDVLERPTEWHLNGQNIRDFRVEARRR